MHYYSHNINDFNNATIHLSVEEECMYHRALAWYYSNELPLPKDKAKIYRYLRATTKKLQTAVNNILDDFFTEKEDGFHQSRCDSEIAEYQSKQAKAVEAGKASANARRKLNENKTDVEQGNNNRSTDVQQEVNDSSATVQPTKNQEPVTNNQDKNNTTPREQNFDIRDWVEPEYSDFIEILQDNDIHMALPNDLYLAEAQKFKNYNANLAAQGKVSLVDDSYRMTKFIDWFKILANKQHASKQAVAAPVVHDDDLPEIYRQSTQSDQTYHPSHAPVAPAKKLPGMFSAYGQNYMPLEGMDAKGTFEAVTEKMGKFYTFAEAYQILKDELSGAVA